MEVQILTVDTPAPAAPTQAAQADLSPLPASEYGFFPAEAKLGTIAAGGTVAKRSQSVGDKANIRMPTAQKRVLAREREKQALALRRGAATYDQIAQSLKVSTGAAYKIVKRALKRVVHQTDYSAKTVVALELQRLDAMTMNIWNVAFGKDTPVELKLRANAELRSIMDRRAKYLSLDYPALQVTEPEDVVAARSMEPIIRNASTEQLIALQAMYSAIAEGKPMPVLPMMNPDGSPSQSYELVQPDMSTAPLQPKSQKFESVHNAKPVHIPEIPHPAPANEFDPAESLGIDPRSRKQVKPKAVPSSIPDWAS